MPFVAAIPGLLSALGVGGTALATAGTVLGGLTSALGVAQGVAQGDPLGATISGLSGLSGGITSGLGGGGSIPATPTGDVVSAANAVSAPAASAISQAGSTASALAPKGMSVLEKIGTGISGVGAATEGVMGLINAFKDNSPSSGSHMGFGGLDTNLPNATGARANPLTGGIPQLQTPEAGKVPTLQNTPPQDNELLLKLLGAYAS